MAIEELKEKLHQLIDTTDNEILLEDLLCEAENRLHTSSENELEGLSEADYADLLSLAKEAPLKDTISYDELKSSLGRWFTK